MKSNPSPSSPKRSFLSRITNSQHLIYDIVGIVLVIACVSLLLRRFDPGWLRINPSPWLLLPLLIGFRYGFWNGIKSGLIGAICSLCLASLPDLGNILSVLYKNAVHYAAFLGVGGVSGFARHLLTDRASALEGEVDLLAGEIKRKDAALALYRENEIHLKQSLLTHNAQFVSLSDELVTILRNQDDNESIEKLMRMLNRNFGILCGGIYTSLDSKRLKLIATIANEDHPLPEIMPHADPIFDLAIREKTLVTCKHLWEADSANSGSPYLAVIPIGQGNAYFVIRRMKLESITWDNLGRIEAVLNYWSGGRGHPNAVTADNFSQAVETAIKLRDDLGVPGYVVQFEQHKSLVDTVAKMATPGYYTELEAKLYVIVMEAKNSASAFGEKVAISLNEPSLKFDVLPLESLQSRG